MSTIRFDLITIGRVSMDLFAENIGAPFDEITGFETGVGGSPSNIAIGSSRLGLKTALLTAVGDDEVGKFVLRYLRDSGVATDYIPTKSGTRTGMAVVGVQPPDKFPLVFYREDPADIYLTIDDVATLPIANTRALLLSGTALSRGTCRDATLFAAGEAQRQQVTTFMDLDMRPDQWSHPQAFGLNIRTILSQLDVVIGTEEEFYGALSAKPERMMQGKSVTKAERDELEGRIANLLTSPNKPNTLVLKRGARGVSIYQALQAPVEAAGFPVEILNTVGAGDAFASGLIYGYLQGWDWYKCARMANACGAIVVTRHGCGTAMPYREEVMDFVDARGGF
ncbi:5-dehydro-2-deoxygluconokinase [Chloroflexi bacterium TSY]|nr:5-dehydro-2-deoxygluconokinase [Chloroflexi bacterium TSY]